MEYGGKKRCLVSTGSDLCASMSQLHAVLLYPSAKLILHNATHLKVIVIGIEIEPTHLVHASPIKTAQGCAYSYIVVL